MREILFRGIWVHGNKEWIEGDLVRDSEGKPHIVTVNMLPIGEESRYLFAKMNVRFSPKPSDSTRDCWIKMGRKCLKVILSSVPTQHTITVLLRLLCLETLMANIIGDFS